MKITWYGTASLKIESEDCAVVLDPYISRNSSHPTIEPSDLEDVNALLLTHGHFDHACDLPYLVSDKQIPVYASPETVRALSGHDEYLSVNLNAALPGKTLNAGKLLITPYQAEHVKFDIPLIANTVLRIIKGLAFTARPLACVISNFFKYSEGEICAWEVKCGKGDVLVFGSMGFAPEVIYPAPDLLVLPLQGHSDIFNIALEAVRRIKPGAVMLDHFDDSFPPISDTIDADYFAELLKEKIPGVKTFVPRHRDKIKVL